MERDLAATIEARGVGLTFETGLEALQEIDLSIDAGSFVSIVGPSGCGKSTFLRLVSGLSHVSTGELTINQLPPIEARQQQRQLSFVLQDATLLGWRRVWNNVALPLELRGVAEADIKTRVEEKRKQPPCSRS